MKSPIDRSRLLAPRPVGHRLAAASVAASVAAVLALQPLGAEERVAARLTTEVPAVDETNIKWVNDPSWEIVDGTRGFEFIPVVDIEVTDLRFYDHDGDGFVQSHPVHLFETASRTVLASATVDGDDPLDPETNYRYERLDPPLLLKAGTFYAVAGEATGPDFDPFLQPFHVRGSVAIDPLITFIGDRGTPFSGDPSDPVFPSLLPFTGQPDMIELGANFSFRPVSDRTYLGVVEEHATPANAVSFPLPQPLSPYPSSSLLKLTGFEFIPRTDIWVTALGFYDHLGDGLLGSHPIGIYDASSRELLTSETVATCSALDPASHFRFADLASPIRLLAGRSYSIVGVVPLSGPSYGGGLLLDPIPQATDAVLDANLTFSSIDDAYIPHGYGTLRYPDLSRLSYEDASAPLPFWFGDGTTRDFSRVYQAVNFRFVTVHPDTPAVTSVSVDRGSRSISIEWTGRTGRTYAVERSRNLVDWEVVATGLPGTEDSAFVRDDFPASLPPRAYYRVRLLE